MPLLEGSDVYPNISSHWSEGFKELKYFRSKKVMKKNSRMHLPIV